MRPSDRQKVMILGSGPNRIGQGIEFDYCCVHASFALREAGFETIMVNCNPETVSTDYDTSDRLYFEPLTHEDVQNVIDAEQPVGIIVGLGGQTPLKLSGVLPRSLVAGTSPESIDLAEDRERWNALCVQLEIPQPPGGTATNIDEALVITERVGFPALVRPSYVLGGRAMRIVDDRQQLVEAMQELIGFGTLGREGGLSAERPVLIDRFLEDATEVDVDALRDATGAVLIGGVMEHVEEAGVHSGDSACALPHRTFLTGSSSHRDLHDRDRYGLAGQRSDQRAVRRSPEPGVRDRSEPTRQSHGPLRCEGDGGSAGEGRCPDHDGRNDRPAEGRGHLARPRARPHVSERSGTSLQPIPRG